MLTYVINYYYNGQTAVFRTFDAQEAWSAYRHLRRHPRTDCVDRPYAYRTLNG